MAKQISIVLVILFLSGLTLLIALPEYSQYNPLRLIIRPLLLLLLIAFISVFFAINVIRNQNRSQNFKNICLTLYGFLILVLLGELFFNYYPRSHGLNKTLQSMNWMYYYYDFNEQGFRDEEYDLKDSSLPKIVFSGDSFTAGYGIKKPANRYTDLIGRQLENKYEFYNIGLSGADTRMEFDLLESHESKPDILILQYYGNDIVNLAKEENFHLPENPAYAGLSFPLKVLVRGTFLGNYIFWKFFQQTHPGYFDILLNCYRDSSLLNLHFQDLQQFVTLKEKDNFEMLVIIFPLLFDINNSSIYIDPVKTFFEAQAIPVLDLSAVINPFPLRKRFVNNNDLHPNELIHKAVADTLYNHLLSKGFLK